MNTAHTIIRRFVLPNHPQLGGRLRRQHRASGLGQNSRYMRAYAVSKGHVAVFLPTWQAPHVGPVFFVG